MRKSEKFEFSENANYHGAEETGLNKRIPLYYLIITVVVCVLLCVGIALGIYFGIETQTSNSAPVPTRNTTATSYIYPTTSVSLSTNKAANSTSQLPISSTSTPRPTVSPYSLRLPKNLVPKEYHLWLKPYLPSPEVTFPNSSLFTFDAQVAIKFLCKTTTTNVTLNGDQLTLDESSFSLVDSASTHRIGLGASGIQYNNHTQMYMFFLNSTLDPGHNYTLTINYTGTLGTDLKGFYRSSYMENQQQKWVNYYLLALPELSFGAMENWGLVTYREYELLYDESVYPAEAKQRVAVVVAHELAHQWFGDLVTMAWWDDLWLNEGFATWIEYRGTDVISNYSFHMQGQFVTKATRVAMGLDQLGSSHPVFQPVASPNQINQLFDAISYEKGGAVLNMLNHTMGPSNFQQGLHVTTQTKTLGWNNQTLNITSFMNRWILQMGFPVLNVHWNPSASSISVSQSRFLVGNSTGKQSIYGYTWHVPLWYYQTANKTGLQWVTPSNTASNPVQISDSAFSNTTNWILMNPQVYGYYRVNYDITTWGKIRNQLLLNPAPVDVRSRAQILDDVMALARANQLNYEMALSFMKYLKIDFSYTPWESGTQSLQYIGSMLALTVNYGYYQKFMLGLALPVYKNMTWNDSSVSDENVLNHKLRGLILGLVCAQSHSDCITNAKKLFNSYTTNCTNRPSSSSCNKIEPNLRKVVYCSAVSAGGSVEWEFLWKKYQMEIVGIERQALLHGLSCPRQPWLVTRLLNAVITNQVRRSEATTVYRYLPVNNQVAMEIMWNYVVRNWNMLVNMFGKNLFALGSLITASTNFLNTQDQYNMVSTFVSSHNNLGTAKSAFQRALAVIQANVQWMQEHSETVVSWLKQNSDKNF